MLSPFVWIITLDLSGMGDSTSSLRYLHRTSRGHVTTQAPPLRQSKDTFRGNEQINVLCILLKRSDTNVPRTVFMF